MAAPTRCPLIALVAALALCACDAEAPPAAPAVPAQDAAPEAPRARPTAFGLPLPPRVLSLERTDREVVVDTDLSLPELTAFYERVLPNHEVLIVGAVLQVLALRPFEASVRGARATGPRSPVRLTYFPGARESARDDTDAAAPEANTRPGSRAASPQALGRSGAAPAPRRRRAQGDPVTLKAPDGTPLAPGARWGVPYTPPAGSPLDTPRNRHNFGRAFGDWRAD